MLCPFCRNETNEAFEAKGFPVLDCSHCGHRFAAIDANEEHANENYSDEYFNGGGAGYADYASESALLRKRGSMYADLIAPYCQPSEMLDVGAAAGYILQGFRDRGWLGRGLEPNKSIAEIGRTELGVEIEHGTLESFETESRYDLISMIQVVAHFYDPKLSFDKARDLLKSGGHLLIETWDRGSLSARTFGKHWHEYSPPTVLHWYSKEWLRQYLEENGFEYVAGGRPSKRISGGHVRSLLKYRLGDISLLRLIPERIEFPYPSEDLFWALFRKR